MERFWKLVSEHPVAAGWIIGGLLAWCFVIFIGGLIYQDDDELIGFFLDDKNKPRFTANIEGSSAVDVAKQYTSYVPEAAVTFKTAAGKEKYWLHTTKGPILPLDDDFTAENVLNQISELQKAGQISGEYKLGVADDGSPAIEDSEGNIVKVPQGEISASELEDMLKQFNRTSSANAEFWVEKQVTEAMTVFYGADGSVIGKPLKGEHALDEESAKTMSSEMTIKRAAELGWSHRPVTIAVPFPFFGAFALFFGVPFMLIFFLSLIFSQQDETRAGPEGEQIADTLDHKDFSARNLAALFYSANRTTNLRAYALGGLVACFIVWLVPHMIDTITATLNEIWEENKFYIVLGVILALGVIVWRWTVRDKNESRALYQKDRLLDILEQEVEAKKLPASGCTGQVTADAGKDDI